MKRTTRLALVLVGLVAFSGVVAAATVGPDNLFDGTSEVADDEITLSANSTYASVDNNGDISINVGNISADSTVRVNDILTAEYSGADSTSGNISFTNTGANLTIYNANGNVADAANATEFTSSGETATFDAVIDATGQSSVTVGSIDVVASAEPVPTQPTVNSSSSSIDPASVTDGDTDNYNATVELENVSDVSSGDVTVELVNYEDGSSTSITESATGVDLSGSTATVTVEGGNFSSVTAPVTGDYEVNVTVDNFDNSVNSITDQTIDTINVGTGGSPQLVTFGGFANTSDGELLAEGREIIGVNTNSGDTGNASVNADGSYNDTLDSVGVNANAGDTIEFYVDDETVASNQLQISKLDDTDLGTTYTVQSSDFDGIRELNLTLQQATLTVEPFAGELPDGESNATALDNVTVTVNETAGTLAGSVDATASVTNSSGAEVANETVSLGDIAASSDADATFFDNGGVNLDAGDYNITVTATSTNAPDASREEAFTLVPAIDSASPAVNVDFYGAVADDGQLNISASSVAAADGSAIDRSATVSLTDTDSSRVIDLGTVSITGGSFDASFDESDIAADIDPGNFEVTIDEFDTGTQFRLVHEVEALGAGTTAISVPAEATVYGNERYFLTRWDGADDTFETDMNDLQFVSADDVNRGMFVSTNSDLRFGWEYTNTDSFSAGETATLYEGWNLVGSNFNISNSQTISVDADLGGQIDASSLPTNDVFTVVDPNTGNADGSVSDRSASDAYWVYAESQLNRELVADDYDATSRAQVLGN